MNELKPLRVCRKCGLKALNEEDLKLFVPHKPSPHGRQNYCTPCRREYARAWRKKNPEKMKKKRKRWRLKLKRKVIDLFGGRCACCGEKKLQFLTMDHIQGGGLKDRKRFGRSSAIWRFMMREYDRDQENACRKYQVLCFNCNLGRQLNNGICPHKTINNNSRKILEDIRRLINRQKDICFRINEFELQILKNEELIAEIQDELEEKKVRLRTIV